MPARSAFVPKYCLHKPSGRAYIRIRGKVVYVGQYGTADSKREYGRLVAELAVRSALPLPHADAQITVTELCAAYWDFAQRYYCKNGRSTSQVHIIRQALRTLRELYGHTPATDFGPLALQAVQSQLIERDLARNRGKISLRRWRGNHGRRRVTHRGMHGERTTVGTAVQLPPQS